MSLLTSYQRWCDINHHQPDPAQVALIEVLQLFEEHCVRVATLHWIKRLWSPYKKRGVFIWGAPGSGKSTIVRMMCRRLQQKNVRVLQVHQHDFNGVVRKTLNQLMLKKTKDPVQVMMRSWAKQYDVIYLDDIHLTDVAGVALLHEIWETSSTVRLVWLITSNRAPCDLYPNGINRHLILKTAMAMSEQMQVFGLHTKDHRIMDVVSSYHQASNSNNIKHAAACFKRWTGQQASASTLEIAGRNTNVLGAQGHVLMIDFDALCQPPRSANDFAWLAQRYTVIIVVNVYHIQASQNSLAISWIRCIDLFYDRQVSLYLFGTVPLDKIYQEGQYQKIYQRTYSRLQEMLGKTL